MDALTQTTFAQLPLGAIFTFAKGREPSRYKDGVGSHVNLAGTSPRGVVTADQTTKPAYWRGRVGRFNQVTGRVE